MVVVIIYSRPPRKRGVVILGMGSGQSCFHFLGGGQNLIDNKRRFGRSFFFFWRWDGAGVFFYLWVEGGEAGAWKVARSSSRESVPDESRSKYAKASSLPCT